MRGLPIALLLAACGAKDATNDYRRTSMSTEARLLLSRIGKNAKVAYAANGALPKGTAGPTPSTPCCTTPEKKCANSPDLFADPVWQQLDVAAYDDLRFQYSYTSDGTTFTATAVGDVLCEGTQQRFQISGKVENNELVVDDSQLELPKK